MLLRAAALRIALALPRALLAAGLLLAACEREAFVREEPSGCRSAGEQCSLEEGPLGVCERASCGPGEEPPCFECTPQH